MGFGATPHGLDLVLIQLCCNLFSVRLPLKLMHASVFNTRSMGGTLVGFGATPHGLALVLDLVLALALALIPCP